MTDAAVLSVAHASKHFGARAALDDVTLEARKGEMIALIGPSGSGKSTLLRALTGLTVLDQGPGRIEAFGEVVQAGGKVSDKIRGVRCRIGFIFQQFNLVRRLTLFQNVVMGSLGRMNRLAGTLGLWPGQTKTAAMAALARMGVADQAAQRAATLSGGQQQRGAIARVLVQQAKIVLADEPVASLDPVAARKVMTALRDLNRTDGLTVIISLHQVEYAIRYCDRIVALSAGKIVYDGPPDGLGRARLVDIYGPEFEDIAHEDMT
jgi:phosphonate transport system ATP-binding protein